MSGFAGPRSRPWVGMAGADTPSQPDARDDAAAASSMKGGAADASTNASAISFGFAATAVLVSLFLIMAIFEHLIKPGLASSSSAAAAHDEDGNNGDGGSGRGLPTARRHPHDGSPDKLRHLPKVEEPVTGAADLPVLMPGQRYPTFLAQPAPLRPCPREGVWWPAHEQQRHSFAPP